MRALSVAGTCLLSLVMVSASFASGQPGIVKVASGRWNGHSWTLSALDSASGSYCTSLSMYGRFGGYTCGTIYPQAASFDPPHGLSWEATNGNHRADYVLGLVVAGAKTVHITLSDSTVISTRTITPPAGLSRKIAFYATQKPCGPYPVSITARSSTGRIVASWKRTVLPPPLLTGHLHC